MKTATLTQSRSRDPGKQSRWVKLLSPGRVIETYSAGIKLPQVACGEADIYLNSYDEFHDWDIFAGHVLVEEAGGKVTGLFGEQLQYGLEGSLATEWIAGDEWSFARGGSECPTEEKKKQSQEDKN